MVIPRAFSSGALSIESNDRNWIFGLCFCSTFVIAAVNVVFPWSTCPIVPTFTCGFVRSNFGLDMLVSHSLFLFDGTCGDQLLRLKSLSAFTCPPMPCFHRPWQ